MLESNPSADKVTEVRGPYFCVRPFTFGPHTLVYNALNSGGLGAGPQDKMLKFLIMDQILPCYESIQRMIVLSQRCLPLTKGKDDTLLF